jgi:hypothetical protein
MIQIFHYMHKFIFIIELISLPIRLNMSHQVNSNMDHIFKWSMVDQYLKYYQYYTLLFENIIQWLFSF